DRFSMRITKYVLALLLAAHISAPAIAQDYGPRTGFAVVTSLTDGAGTLIFTETLSYQPEGGNVIQATLKPELPIMGATMPVNIGSLTQGTSGIAIVNPSPNTAIVTMSLTNEQGELIFGRSFNLAPGTQFAGFLRDLFADQLAP